MLATPERMRASDSSRPSSSRLSYRPGEIREPVTATRRGGYTVLGFSPSSSHSPFNATSIVSAAQGSTPLSARTQPGPDLAEVQRRTVRTLVVSQAVGAVGVTIGVATASLLARDISGSETMAGLAQTFQVLGTAVLQNNTLDLPFAAALGTVSVLVMVVYLLAVRRTGALDNL